ncbi:MAG: hypothetical protein GY810_03195 [Aureispira sp.]|nr:hypothetical protein [Aureispira sp.]
MAIDILFIIMATFGFYFGYTFGLMRVVLFVLSLLVSLGVAMRFTSVTVNLIQDTFDVDSPFLPFVAFLITLIGVMLIARIVVKLLEETVDKDRFDRISRIIGGFMLSFVFTFLFSVLITFFGKAGVIDLAYNETLEIMGQEANFIKIISTDTMLIKQKNKPGILCLGDIMLLKDKRSGLMCGGRFVPIPAGDTVMISGSATKDLEEDDIVAFFCEKDMAFIGGDTINCYCSDNYPAAKHATSTFFKYIQVIPQTGRKILENAAPFIKDFIKYMTIALERLEKGKKTPPKPIEVTDDDKPVEPIPNDIFVDTSKKAPVTPPKDSVAKPIIKDSIKKEPTKPIPTPTEEEKDTAKYEG